MTSTPPDPSTPGPAGPTRTRRGRPLIASAAALSVAAALVAAYLAFNQQVTTGTVTRWVGKTAFTVSKPAQQVDVVTVRQTVPLVVHPPATTDLVTVTQTSPQVVPPATHTNAVAVTQTQVVHTAAPAPHCSDFHWQQDAQAAYLANVSDPGGLDGPPGPDNGRGLACSSLPRDPSRPTSPPVDAFTPPPGSAATKAALVSPAAAYFGVIQNGLPGDASLAAGDAVAFGKAPSTVGWSDTWQQPDFSAAKVRAAWSQGELPVITWLPYLPGQSNRVQGTYSLQSIVNGTWDQYLYHYAGQVVQTGLPVAIRLMPEMNGNWYPWSAGYDLPLAGTHNSPALYGAAWRHVWTIFNTVGATPDVIWTWTPERANVTAPGSTTGITAGETGYAEDYPGDGYVDWLGLSAYEFKPTDTWSFADAFAPSLAQLRQLSPKPIFIAEMAAARSLAGTDLSQRQAQWTRQALDELAAQPDVVGVTWFNEVNTIHTWSGAAVTTDWRLQSAPAALTGFTAGVNGTRFVSGIPPWDGTAPPGAPGPSPSTMASLPPPTVTQATVAAAPPSSVTGTPAPRSSAAGGTTPSRHASAAAAVSAPRPTPTTGATPSPSPTPSPTGSTSPRPTGQPSQGQIVGVGSNAPPTAGSGGRLWVPALVLCALVVLVVLVVRRMRRGPAGPAMIAGGIDDAMDLPPPVARRSVGLVTGLIAGAIALVCAVVYVSPAHSGVTIQTRYRPRTDVDVVRPPAPAQVRVDKQTVADVIRPPAKAAVVVQKRTIIDVIDGGPPKTVVVVNKTTQPVGTPEPVPHCWDFRWQQDAQAAYLANLSDPGGLSGPPGPHNGNGLACSELPTDPGRPASVPVDGYVPPPAPTKAQVLAAPGVYVGISEDGLPGDVSLQKSDAAYAGKAPSAVEWFANWDEPDYGSTQVQQAWALGQLPIITWMPENRGGSTVDQSRYSLKSIIDGAWDTYLYHFAGEVVRTNLPVGLRFMHEFNGDWYPWSAGLQAPNMNVYNTPAQYIAAWRHVWQIFQTVGANENVIWIWSPVRVDGIQPGYRGMTALSEDYPGDRYTDVLGLSAYQWKPTEEWTFTNTFSRSFTQLRAVSSKPIFVMETGAAQAIGNTDFGSLKAQWTSQTLSGLLSTPGLLGFVWFNNDVKHTHRVGGQIVETNWQIQSSPAALAAFRAGIADTRYMAGVARGAPNWPPGSPPPPGAETSPTPSPSAVPSSSPSPAPTGSPTPSASPAPTGSPSPSESPTPSGSPSLSGSAATPPGTPAPSPDPTPPADPAAPPGSTPTPSTSVPEPGVAPPPGSPSGPPS